MDEEINVEIVMPIKQREKAINEENKALNDLRNTLLANYGTADLNQAVNMIVALTILELGIDLVTGIYFFQKLMVPLPELELEATVAEVEKQVEEYQKWLEEHYPELPTPTDQPIFEELPKLAQEIKESMKTGANP